MIGTITINGNYQQVKVSAVQEGKMEFDLAGIGNTDLINVSGAVTLGGSIGRGLSGLLRRRLALCSTWSTPDRWPAVLTGQ